ncbi:hypothetical protein [Corynebacterium sp. 335C]
MRDDAPLGPAGVIPPEGPARPGEAALGPDGLYDYAAVPGFTPENPCEGAWRAAASAAGYEQRPGDLPPGHNPQRPTCGLSKLDGTATALSGDHRGRKEYAALGFEVTDHRNDDVTWYTVKLPSEGMEGTGVCRATLDLPSGSIGILAMYTNLNPDQFLEAACESSSEQLLEIWSHWK